MSPALSFRQRFWLVLGSVLLLDTLILLAYWKINLGTLLPGGIGAYLLCLVWQRQRLARWREHPGFAVLWRLACGLAVASALGGVAFVLWASQAQTPSAAPAPAPAPAPAAIIVLGAGLRGSAPSPALQNRLDVAAALARQYPAALIVVSGGQGLTEPVTESSAMQRYLIGVGIASQRIVQERQSTSTEENLTFSKRLLIAQGLDPAAHLTAIVTSDFHRLRTTRLASRLGYAAHTVCSAPTPLSIRPNAWLREYLVCLKSWLLGEI